MGWFAAFVADVLYNVFSGGEKQPERSSYGHSDHPRQIQYAPSPKSSSRYSRDQEKRREEKQPEHSSHGYSCVHPRQIQHAPSPKSSNRYSSEEKRRDEKRASRHHVLQRRTAYEERGVATRTYKDSKGKDVVEQKQYRVKKYEEHQLSPARTESSRPGSKHR